MATKQLSTHIHQLYFGGNWTSVFLQSLLKDLEWEKAVFKYENFNSIATLAYHINYYVHNVANVLEGDSLKAKDEDSFACPEITSQKEWEAFLAQVWSDGERFSTLVGKLDDEVLNHHFTNSNYGSYLRNLLGILEHSHYHLGQIAILKKLGMGKK